MARLHTCGLMKQDNKKSHNVFNHQLPCIFHSGMRNKIICQRDFGHCSIEFECTTLQHFLKYEYNLQSCFPPA